MTRPASLAVLVIGGFLLGLSPTGFAQTTSFGTTKQTLSPTVALTTTMSDFAAVSTGSTLSSTTSGQRTIKNGTAGSIGSLTFSLTPFYAGSNTWTIGSSSTPTVHVWCNATATLAASNVTLNTQGGGPATITGVGITATVTSNLPGGTAGGGSGTVASFSLSWTGSGNRFTYNSSYSSSSLTLTLTVN